MNTIALELMGGKVLCSLISNTGSLILGSISGYCFSLIHVHNYLVEWVLNRNTPEKS